MNKVLVIVDYQNDFITGSLGSPQAKEIEKKIINKINNHGGQIIFTMDKHHEGYLNTREGKALPIKHCITGTEGAEIKNDVLKSALVNNPYGTFIIKKETFAPDFNTVDYSLNIIITNADIIEIVGVCTDICCISTAIAVHTLNKKAEIIIDASCCAGTTIENHNKALDIMQNSLLMKVINRGDVNND